MDKSVGLVIMTDIPSIGLVAVLRERGRFNPETMKAESWPGVCQVTVHGRLEEGEHYFEGLLRELTEELGNDFAFAVSILLNISPISIVEISRFQNENKEVVNYTIKIDCSLLKKIRLAPESGAIRLIYSGETTSIADVWNFNKATGVQDRSVIAMFADEKEAVVKAFAFACSR